MDEKRASANASASGIGFCSLLTIVFIVLKLLHVINWSWFWVLSPLIFSTALTILLIAITIIVILFIKFISNR